MCPFEPHQTRAPPLNTPQHIAESLRRALRATILIEDVPHQTRFIIEPATGLIIANTDTDPLEHAAANDHTITLHAPDEHEDSTEALVTLESILDHKTDHTCDRWRAYHLHEDAKTYAALRVQAARLGTDRESVTDGINLPLANTLAHAETAIVRHYNQNRPALRALLINPDKHDEPPTLVGVDHAGLHLRARFAVRRITFDTPADSPEQAHANIDKLLTG